MPPTRLTIALSILIVVIIVAGIELFSFSFSSQFETFLYSSSTSAPNTNSSTATSTATGAGTNNSNAVRQNVQHGNSMNNVMSNTNAEIKSSSSSSLSSLHEYENNSNNNNNNNNDSGDDDSEDESDFSDGDDAFLSSPLITHNFKWSLDERIRELDKAQENYFIGDKYRRKIKKTTKNQNQEEKNLHHTVDDDVQGTSEDKDDEVDEEDNDNSPFVSPTIFDAVCSNLAQFYPSVSCSSLQRASTTNTTTTNTDYYENDTDTMTDTALASSLIPPVAELMDQQKSTPRIASPSHWISPFMKKLLLSEHHHSKQNDSKDEYNNNYPYPFDSMRSWIKWCAASPLHCYRPECYYPLKVLSHQRTSEGKKGDEDPSAFLRHRYHHHKSFLRQIDKSNFAAAVEDFQLDPDLIGKGCRPNPFYHPPESMIVRRRNTTARRRSLSLSSTMQMDLNGSKNENVADPLHHLQKMKRSSLLPRRRRRAKGTKLQHSEFTCLHRKSDSKESHRYFFDHQHQHHDERKSAVSKNIGSSSSSFSYSIEKFKKRTSWMFSKWYDWSGKCVRRRKIKANTNSSFRRESPKQEEFQLSGSHSKKDGLYRLKNVCFRPHGGLVGYLGGRGRKFSDVLDPYSGTDDVGSITQLLQMNLVDFIQNENNHKLLEKPADCYLDTKVILFPLDWRTDNPGHCFYRTGFTLRCIESAFGRDAMWSKENVTVAYVRVAPADRPFLHTKESLMKSNMMKYYYDILGTSWFSINGVPPNRSSMSREEKIRVEREMYDGYSPTAEEEKEEQQQEPMACFKEVVIAQSGLMTPLGPETKANTRRFFFDTNTKINRRTSFNIYGPRSLRDRHTLDILDLKLRSCQNLPPRRKLARFAEKNHRQQQHHQGVRVLFAIRSQYRRLSMQPYLISFLAARVRLEFGDNAILEVIEHSQLTFQEIILRYSQADVLIAGYGAALMWSMFLPPKAIVVEIAGFRQGQSRGSGFNINRHTEYGGGSLVQDQFHATVFDPAKFSRWPAGMNYSSDFSDIELSSTLAVNKMDNIISLSGFNFLVPLIGCVAKRLPTILHTSTVLSSDADRIDACAPLPACCQFSDASSLKFLSETPLSNPNVFDRQTVPMLLNLRLFPSPPSSSPSRRDFKVNKKDSKSEAEKQKHQKISFFSPRLEALIRQPAITDVFVTATKHFSMPSSPAFETAVKILFIEPCGRDNDDEIRPSIFAEVVALRQIFQRIEHVYVAKVSSSKSSSNTTSSVSSFCDYSLQRDHSSPNTTNGHVPIFSRAKKTFREFLGVERDGEYDAFTEGMFRTCQFPCTEFGPFDLTIHDCFFSDNSAKKTTTMAQQCIVNLREPLLHETFNDHRVPPSATEVFTKTTNGLLGVILSFAYDDKSRYKNQNKYLKSQTPTALFAFRGPVLGRLRDDKAGNIITPKMQSVFNLSSVPFAVAASQQQQQKQQQKRRMGNQQDNDDVDVDYEAFHSPILYPSFKRRIHSQNLKNQQRSSPLMNKPSMPKYDHTPHVAFVYDDNLYRAFVEKQFAARRRRTFDICRDDDDEIYEDNVDAPVAAAEEKEEEKICIPRYHQDSNNVTLLWQKNMFFTELSLKRHSSDVPFALFFKTSSSSRSSLRSKFIARKNRTNHSRNKKRDGLLWIHEDLLPSTRMKPVIPSNNNDLLFPQSHVEFGFNLMVQQVIGSSLAFDPSRTREELRYFKNFYPDDY